MLKIGGNVSLLWNIKRPMSRASQELPTLRHHLEAVAEAEAVAVGVAEAEEVAEEAAVVEHHLLHLLPTLHPWLSLL